MFDISAKNFEVEYWISEARKAFMEGRDLEAFVYSSKASKARQEMMKKAYETLEETFKDYKERMVENGKRKV